MLFGFCDECPEYNIIDDELYDRPNNSLIILVFTPIK